MSVKHCSAKSGVNRRIAMRRDALLGEAAACRKKSRYIFPAHNTDAAASKLVQ
jgi:hypothetical protein